jgi:enterochelin esterase family protein
MTDRLNVLVLVALGVAACTSSSPGGTTGGTGGTTISAGTGGSSLPGTGGAPSSTGGASSQTGGTSPAATGGAGGGTVVGTGGGSPQSDAGVGSGGVTTSPDAAGTASGGAGGSPGGAAGSVVTDPGTDGDGDVTLTGPYKAAAEHTVAAGVMRGTVQSFTMSSSDSKIFPMDTTGAVFTRKVQLYTPVGYVPGTESPFIVLQDGSQYQGNLIPVLDNMISDGRLPKMLAVLIEPGPGGQRSVEYDTVSDAYFNFMETEVLPKIEAMYNVKFTTDPTGRAAMGGSSGAPAAMGMAWFGSYTRIVSYSGSFVDLKPTTMYPHGAWSYHETMIPGSDPKPIRISLEVGDQDNGSTQTAASMLNWILGNQGMAAALKAKGYHYKFMYATGGVGHVNSTVIDQTLPDVLAWLWRGYQQ